MIDPQDYIDQLLECAARSPCTRDKRGALVIGGGGIIGRGWNAPVGGDCSDRVCRKATASIIGGCDEYTTEQTVAKTLSCSLYVEHAEARAIQAAHTSRAMMAGKEFQPGFRLRGELSGCDLVHLNTARCKDWLHQHGNENANALPPCQYCNNTARIGKPSRRGNACPTRAVQALNHGISGIWLYHLASDRNGPATEWVRYTMDEYGREAGVIS